jgi:hypothetical protein
MAQSRDIHYTLTDAKQFAPFCMLAETPNWAGLRSSNRALAERCAH